MKHLIFASASMLRRYAHLAPEHLAEHAERIARPRVVAGHLLAQSLTARSRKR